jgi:hypothetical protein
MRLILFLFLFFFYSCTSELNNKIIDQEQSNKKAKATFSMKTGVGLEINN